MQKIVQPRGNKRGRIRLHSQNTGYVELQSASNTTNPIVTIPALTGTLSIQRAMAQIVYGRQTVSIGTAWGSGNLTTISSSYTQGSGLTISSNSIKINNSSIKKVKVTAYIEAYRNTANGDTGARVNKNGNSSFDITYSSYNSSYQYWTPRKLCC